MGISQLVVSSLMSLLGYGLLVFGVFKIYQVASELSEIKELLRDIKRNTEDGPMASTAQPESVGALARAVQAASYPLPESESVSRSAR